MKNKLSCSQVIALLSLYLDDKLNTILKSSVKEHLKDCPECRRLYSARNVKPDSGSYGFDFDSGWMESLSAYIDNELDDNDAVKMRKITITNPMARKKLEDIYSIQREMHNHFNRIKSECKIDYSKGITAILNGEKTPDAFNRLVWTFTAMLSVILVGFIAMLYF